MSASPESEYDPGYLEAIHSAVGRAQLQGIARGRGALIEFQDRCARQVGFRVMVAEYLTGRRHGSHRVSEVSKPDSVSAFSLFSSSGMLPGLCADTKLERSGAHLYNSSLRV